MKTTHVWNQSVTSAPMSWCLPAGKLQWALNAIFFILDPDIMYLEPKSLLIGPDLGFVGPGPRVDMLGGPMCVLSSKVKGPGCCRTHTPLSLEMTRAAWVSVCPQVVHMDSGSRLISPLPHFTSIFLLQLPPPVDFKAQFGWG